MSGSKKKLVKTTREALSSVLPITVIVFLLSVFVSPMPVGALVLFLFGSVLLVVGMGLFTMGADMALVPMGGDIGASITKSKKIALVIAGCFSLGVIVTMAEPDLQILAQLVPGIPNIVIVLTVASGVGVFLAAAILRILFRIDLPRLLIALYALTAVLAIFTPPSFLSVAFDSGGVTTGPVTVPFIMAMGLGLASIRGDRGSLEDSFGLVALCSIGPILSVLILGICFNPAETPYTPAVIPEIATSRDATMEFVRSLPQHFLEVAGAVWPILAVLLFFQIVTRQYRRLQLMRILIGFVYTFGGLVLFFTGVNVGFIPAGQALGSDIAASPAKWLLVPLGALIGYFIVAAEPAVHILRKQVEDISGGAIPGAAVLRYLSLGVSCSLAVSMLRVLTGIPIFCFLLPGYAIAAVLTFFTPKIFTGIAFDSGGVVSGPMTSTFLLPFVIGACVNPGKIMTDAFGLVAMVAMTPLIAIQLMGIVYKNKMKHAAEAAEVIDDSEDEIAEFEENIDNGEQ